MKQKNRIIEVNGKQITVTAEDIDDILCIAFEGGIDYWCSEATVPKEEGFLGDYASEQISRGGTVLIYEKEERRYLKLELDSLLFGIKHYIEYGCCNDIVAGDEKSLDTCMVDAEVADMIVQYALFEELVYG